MQKFGPQKVGPDIFKQNLHFYKISSDLISMHIKVLEALLWFLSRFFVPKNKLCWKWKGHNVHSSHNKESGVLCQSLVLLLERTQDENFSAGSINSCSLFCIMLNLPNLTYLLPYFHPSPASLSSPWTPYWAMPSIVLGAFIFILMTLWKTY